MMTIIIGFKGQRAHANAPPTQYLAARIGPRLWSVRCWSWTQHGQWVPQLGSEQANRLSPAEYLSRIGRTADGEHKALLQLDFNGAPAR